MTARITNKMAWEGMTEQEIYQARFLGNVEQPNGFLGCWEWRAGRSDRGTGDGNAYGRFWMNGKAVRVNRAAYELFVGPLAEDEQVLHFCNRPTCASPHHMYKGTHANNVRDRVMAGRSRGRNSKTLTEPVAPWTEQDFWRYFYLD